MPDDLNPIAAKKALLSSPALPWREVVQTIGELHETFLFRDSSWSVEKTIQELKIGKRRAYAAVFIFQHLDSPLISSAPSLLGAYNILKNSQIKSIKTSLQEIYSQDWFSEKGQGHSDDSKPLDPNSPLSS